MARNHGLWKLVLGVVADAHMCLVKDSGHSGHELEAWPARERLLPGLRPPGHGHAKSSTTSAFQASMTSTCFELLCR